MGGRETRRPVTQRLVDRVLEALRAAGYRHHGRAHQLHSENIERLPLDILGTHVNHRVEAEQGADDRGRDAMLSGTGFGDQPGLAHAPGEQRLTEHLVGLVRAAVEQIFALQIDSPGKVAAEGQRGRAAGIIGQQFIELGAERHILLAIEEGGLELLDRRHQDFGDKGAAEASEASVQAHCKSSCLEGERTASNKAAIFAGSLWPGASSTAEPTSTA